ncbi:MAG: Kef-type potassium/proton antiporter, family, partial [Polaromonas sp.]|nr:Kef-type potassium/proton antiporter, family [Polaromonas sp.]
LFFVSVGMLFDPWVLLERPLQVLAVVAIIIVGKSLAAGLLVLAFRYRLNTALTVSASLAQIGEFSFILVGLGASLGLLPREGQSLVLAGALVSIALNQLVFKAVDPLEAWILSRSAFARRLDARSDPTAELPAATEERYLALHVVLVGYGRVGRRIAEALLAHHIPFVVVEQNREVVERLRSSGLAAVSGNAAEAEVLVQAHIAHARMLVVATPETLDVRQMVATARALNPAIETVLRSHNEVEASLLDSEKAGTVFLGEHELAMAMTRHVLERSATAGPGFPQH